MEKIDNKNNEIENRKGKKLVPVRKLDGKQ